jgi:hypothetical protein
MVVNDAVMLGFSRNRHYFDGEVFAKGDSIVLTVEGFILDLSNSGDVSPTIADEMRQLFALSRGEASGPVYGGPSIQNVSAGVTIADIVINNINYGKGRITSIESPSAPGSTENKITAGRYIFTVEFLQSLGSAVFEIKGPVGTDYYDKLEVILEPYAHRLDTFQESFMYSKTANGQEEYSHNIDVKVREDGNPYGAIIGTTIAGSPKNIAAYIAWYIYNHSEPSFPLHVIATFDIEDGNPAATNRAESPHDAFYSESINNINGLCRFTKTWSKTLSIDPGSNNNVGTGGIYRFVINNQQFTVKFTYSISKDETGSTVIEKADILKVGGGMDADGHRKKIVDTAAVFDQVADLSLGRCQDALTELVDSTDVLVNVNLDTKIFETPQENRFGYEISFSSDQNIIDTYGGFKIERSLSVQRLEDGINQFSQESTATPIKQGTVNYGVPIQASQINQRNEIATRHTITNILQLISGTILPEMATITGFTNGTWASYYASVGLFTMDKIQPQASQVNVDPIFTPSGKTYIVSCTQTWTDDRVVQKQWSAMPGSTNGSYFTRKQVNIENTAPVRKKETYMVAGWGEVLHASPQSEIGSLIITFNGTIKREFSHNIFANGLPLPTSDWLAMLREATNECQSQFGRVINPKHMFITDTQYTFDSEREFSMTVTLSYTKQSYTTTLETRT